MPTEDDSARAAQELARIQKLVEMMTKHGLVEMELKPDGSLRLRKAEEAPKGAAGMTPVFMPAPWMQQGAMPPAAAAASAPPAAAESAPAAAAAPKKEEGLVEFKSPIVGTFYRSPSPDKEAFVDRGSRIKPDSVLCIIEAMKVMNEIRAEVSGEIVEVHVKNGEAVEFGQPLFSIRPA